jgi:hypothetical protein
MTVSLSPNSLPEGERAEVTLREVRFIELRQAALFWLAEPDPARKAEGVRLLAQAGDRAAAAILDIILRDEIGHVGIGKLVWRLCEQRGLEPVSTYARLAAEYQAPVMRGPFNLEARRAAGFSEGELAALK